MPRPFPRFSLLAFTLYCISLFAESPGDRRVTVAFHHAQTGNSFIQVHECVDAGRWSDFEGAAGYYWGNLASGFFKINLSSHGGTSYGTRHSLKMTILAPTAENKKREAKLSVTFSTEETSHAGTLDVSCEGRSACFDISEAQRLLIEKAIQQNGVALNPLPNIRRIKYFLKFPSENRYLVVDESRLCQEYEDLEIFFWENGTVTHEIIADRQQYFDEINGGLRGDTYLTLQNGDVIFIPAPLHPHKFATWMPKGGDEKALIEIRAQDLRKQLRRELGLPDDRYRLPILRTPCEVLVEAVSSP